MSEALYAKISLGAPAATHDEVRELLKADYGLSVQSVAILGGEIDQNLRVNCDDGRSYVVKIASDLAEEASLNWQCAILEHLAQEAPALPVPRLVRTVAGASHVTLLRGSRGNAVRVLTWLPGQIIGEVRRKSPELLYDLGAVAGSISNALSSVDTSDATTGHHWDLARAGESVEACLPFVIEPDDRSLIERTMRRYQAFAAMLSDLPTSVAHQDLNDFNVLVHPDKNRLLRVCGVIDVGDALCTIRVSELAVAVAYAMLRTPDPLRAATQVVRGFAAVASLTEAEVAAVFPLATARLCMNAATWTRRVAMGGSAYGASRMKDTWPLLAELEAVRGVVAEAAFRSAAGYRPWPDGPNAATAIGASAPAAASTGITLRTTHLEPSPDHVPVRATTEKPQPETLELGVRLTITAADAVCTPLPGTIEAVDADVERVVVRHELDALPIWSRWTGVLSQLERGATVDGGQAIGRAADTHPAEAGNIHLLLVSAEELHADVLPTRVQPWLRDIWADLCPDPTRLLGTEGQPPQDHLRDAVALRKRYVGHAQRFYYEDPMSLVSSDGVWLHDVDGLKYLDVINNVTHVGHADPTVADAISRQARRLNTNSRFVYAELGEYAQRLVAHLPEPLAIVYFVCTGSEANDLALRIARQTTGREHVLVVDGAYHGNTTAVLAISPDRYDGPGGSGRPETTHTVPAPNRYRGPYGYDDLAAGSKYAGAAASVVDRLTSASTPPAAFFCESLIGSAGQVTLPANYLEDTFTAVRRAGGLCVSDEVQVGFGRLGRFCGFELQGVVPDIVTLGKPMGNGMPLAAVVTTREVAEEFDRGMKYFNTFAGNPVSCAAGMAVLDVLERDQLQERASTVGSYLLSRLSELQTHHALIGDVRGQGLYLGLELVKDRTSKVPAGPEALYISERLRQEGIAIYPNGRDGNILKMKPPMIFDQGSADLLVDALDRTLSTEW